MASKSQMAAVLEFLQKSGTPDQKKIVAGILEKSRRTERLFRVNGTIAQMTALKADPKYVGLRITVANPSDADEKDPLIAPFMLAKRNAAA